MRAEELRRFSPTASFIKVKLMLNTSNYVLSCSVSSKWFKYESQTERSKLSQCIDEAFDDVMGCILEWKEKRFSDYKSETSSPKLSFESVEDYSDQMIKIEKLIYDALDPDDIVSLKLFKKTSEGNTIFLSTLTFTISGEVQQIKKEGKHAIKLLNKMKSDAQKRIKSKRFSEVKKKLSSSIKTKRFKPGQTLLYNFEKKHYEKGA
jgi:hypothetical protein